MLNSKAKVKHENTFNILKPEREVETKWQYKGLYTTHHHQDSREWALAISSKWLAVFQGRGTKHKKKNATPLPTKAHSGPGDIKRRGKNVLCTYFSMKQTKTPLIQYTKK